MSSTSGLWRLTKHGNVARDTQAPVLPDINSPAVLYLAAALSERRRLFIAPESVIRALHDQRWLLRATFLPDLSHGVALLDVDGIELGFPPVDWQHRDIACPALDDFCEKVFSRIEAHWQGHHPKPSA